jgi:hypothetical protein
MYIKMRYLNKKISIRKKIILKTNKTSKTALEK